MGVRTFKDKQGRTRYRVTFGRDGRRLVDTRLPAGVTQDQANTYHAKLTTSWFDQARLGIQQVPLISEVIREYEKRIVPGLKSPAFARNCITAAAPHVLGRTLEQLPEAADSLILALRGAAGATISHRVGFLITLGRYAVLWRLVKQDYSRGIERPAFNNERQFYIDKRVLAKILKGATKQVRLACWQLFYTGMRRGELCGAKLEGNHYILAETKNGDRRIVPVPDACSRIASIPSMLPNSLSASFRAAARKSGYGHIHLHDLRHSTASQLLNAGADLGTVGFILGHRDGRSTRRYAHLATETARRWMNFAASGRQVVDTKPLRAGTPPRLVVKKRA